MAYSELIKSVDHVRKYVRDFYVYGFKSRSEYNHKSGRSYDNERRRVESWLGDYTDFRQDAGGKNIFLSLDSRLMPRNPLYKVWKAKSFTGYDICLHFFILDMLTDGRSMTIGKIMDLLVQNYFSCFQCTDLPDISTLRGKLNEYCGLGLLTVKKQGKQTVYSLSTDHVELNSWRQAIAFFSEAGPLGVIGSYLLNRMKDPPTYFSFKHHYLLHALDSGILLELLMAMEQKREVRITTPSRRKKGERILPAVPLKVFVSVQSGRQYIAVYHKRLHRIAHYRLDSILAVAPGEIDMAYDTYMECLQKHRQHLWGVAAGNASTLEHIEMTLHIANNEPHILVRLNREKRCGKVVKLDDCTWHFAADVYDALELMPFVRTFTGRVVHLSCSNPVVTQTFYQDLAAMKAMYGGGTDVVP